MAGVTIFTEGNLSNMERYLNKLRMADYRKILDQYGRKGVDALRSATPVDTGATAASWSYEVHSTADGYEIVWSNSHVNDGVSIALILQYGHGTGTGGYVTGIDYINPALRPIFTSMVADLRKAVTNG